MRAWTAPARGRAFATPFALRIRTADGEVEDIAARAVIDASGTYLSPNSLSSSGLELLGMADIADRVTPALPDVLGRDRALFAGRHTTVVGAGHSAANTLLGLVELARQEPGTTVTWLIRNAQAVRVSSSADDELADRARLGSRVDRAVADGRITVVDGFEIIRGRRAGDAVELVGHRRGEVVTHTTDVVVNATGFRPDLDMLREIRLELDDIVEAPEAPRAAHRPERPLVRHGRAARLPRAHPPRAGLLHRRHEVLRARADVPARHRLRAGPLGHRLAGGRHRVGRRTSSSSSPRPACAPPTSSDGGGCCS